MTSATTTVLRTEARLAGRELGSLFWIVIFPTGLLVILGAIPSFREPSADLGGQRTIDLYVSTSVILSTIMAAIFAMPGVVANYRERGILRRLRATPVHPGSLLLAQVVVHGAALLLATVLVLGVGRVVYDVALPESLGWYGVGILLTAATTFAIGAAITAASPTTRVAQAMSTVVAFPAMFTAGLWFPVQAMTGWLHATVTATPLGAAAEVLNDALLGTAPGLADIAVILGWTGLLAILAVRFFRWD